MTTPQHLAADQRGGTTAEQPGGVWSAARIKYKEFQLGQPNKTDLLQVLLDMRSGAVAADCNEKFNEVLQAVIETGGSGELNLKLKLKPSKLGMGGAVLEVQASHELKTKKPELEIGNAFFFVGKDGTLTREDPAQTVMFEEVNKNVGAR